MPQDSPQTPLVELRGVSQLYGDPSRPFTALENVSLSVRQGEFVMLVGPSGCGKSTLLRIIVGLQRASKGGVFYRGQPLSGVNPHASIVFQTFALFPWLTVQMNVEVALKARGVPAAERTERAVHLLDMVGLDGFENAYPRELSGGMRQKVGFARAMAVQPELLCLDEPFSALDVLSAESLRGELLELWTTGALPTRAILMVTHNIEEAVLLGSRVIVMEAKPGRIATEIDIPLPHPRSRQSPEFLALVDRIYAIIAGSTQPEHVEHGAAPGQPGRVRALPQTTVNSLNGLLEHLDHATGQRADIYRLPQDLKVDPKQLMAAIEAAELLGFATVREGDVAITPLGSTVADASITARKEIYAERLRRLPLFRWLLELLQTDEDHRISRAVVTAALELEFAPDESSRQATHIIGLGRYAELFGYDERAGMLFLEPSPLPATAAATPDPLR